MASGQEELSITIPPEIITEILYRLPAKSIGRFRCVSKAWLSQLTHFNFIKIHLNNTSSHQNHLIFKIPHDQCSLFLYSHPFHSREVVVTTPTKLDLQLNSNPYSAGVCGSCNGLVLFRVRCPAHLTTTMVVINPTTKECLQLPQEDYCNFYDTNNYNEYICLGSLYGFGYDSVTDDYKVVSLSHYYYTDRAEKVYVDVYSLRNKKWRRITDSPYVNHTSYGIFVNGFIHWIVFTDDGDLIGIAAFSLADECFSEDPFPIFHNTLKRNECELLVLGGKLAIFINSEGVVWLMNEYGVTESWTEIILHGIDKVMIFEPNYISYPSVFDDNGKFLVADNDRMMVYEVEKASFTETVCAWNPEMFCIAGFYVESLVSPKLGKEEDDNDKNEEDDACDLWKAKHQEEKLRADRLEEAMNYALSKQQFLSYRLEDNEATIQSNLAEIQALERRTLEQEDEIESLKARLALADEERRKAVADLSEMVKNALNWTKVLSRPLA